MRIAVWMAAAGLVLAAVPAWAARPLPDPIAPANQGKAQCYEPDAAAKTCRSIAKYQRGPKGEILNPTLVMLSAQPLIAFAGATKVEVKDGRVCGVVQASDIEAGAFMVDGKPATAEQTAGLAQSLEQAEAGILGKEICTAYVPDGDAFLAKATVGGVAQPDAQHVIWISDSDGYTLGGQ